jgi:hypothetical protein
MTADGNGRSAAKRWTGASWPLRWQLRAPWLLRAMRTPARPVLASAFRSAGAWRGRSRACARSGSVRQRTLLHSASSVPPPVSVSGGCAAARATWQPRPGLARGRGKRSCRSSQLSGPDDIFTDSLLRGEITQLTIRADELTDTFDAEPTQPAPGVIEQLQGYLADAATTGAPTERKAPCAKQAHSAHRAR